MKYVSTRGWSGKIDFLQAVERGLAPDGGLFVPEEFPTFRVNDFVDMSFPKIASRILRPFLRDNFDSQQVDAIAEKAFYFPVTLKKISEQTTILELFHGPTAAFKDIAAQFLGEVMPSMNQGQKTILVATSGDTGGAVAAAFDGRSGFRVVILFPKNGVSLLQRQQLTCWSSNIISLAVDGCFDDCQRIVKSLLGNPIHRERFHLTSANSINIARLLPQSTYYAAASLWWWRERNQKAQFIIPTGNMGNAVAAFWAKKMGFPIEKIVMATNANHVISDYYRNGEFKPHPSLVTLANAMDVGNPSNFERLKSLHPDLRQLLLMSESHAVSDEQIRSTISQVYNDFNEIICPHTATAMAVRQTLAGEWIVVSSAHPAKFNEVVEPIVKVRVPEPTCLQELRARASKFIEIRPTESDVLRWF